MRIFKTKWFKRFARKEGLTDEKLMEAIQELENGLHNGDLGGNLIKKRVSRPGEGKSGGYRTIIVYSVKKRTVFVYGFSKNSKANLSGVELVFFQKLAQLYLSFSDTEIEKAVDAGEFEEISKNEKKISK